MKLKLLPPVTMLYSYYPASYVIHLLCESPFAAHFVGSRKWCRVTQVVGVGGQVGSRVGR